MYNITIIPKENLESILPFLEWLNPGTEHNIMVHPDYQNKGVGDELMNWIHNYALENGCNTSELNSRVVNHRGHKFFMRLGYEIIGYHFIRKLK